MPHFIGALRATVLVAAIAAGSAVPAAAADGGVSAARAAQDASLVGRPSQDTPDACAALPLEWRLRCYGGPAHSVRDIGAPYGAVDGHAPEPAPQSQPAWLHQWGSAEAPCSGAAAALVSSPQ
jgi:hypothetical protein